MLHADVLIAGAGPAGSYLSQKLAGFGLDVALADKKSTVGKYACSGLVSSRITSFLKLDSAYVEHRVQGAVFHSPNCKFELSRKKVQAYVLDRPEFDRHNFFNAVSAGARPFLGHEVKNIAFSDDGVLCTIGRKKIKASVAVGADGAGSFMRRSMDLKGNTHMINGIIAYTDEASYDPFVELFYGRSVAPGFFAWRIPRGKRTEYGLAAATNHIEYFKRFLGSRAIALKRFYAHPLIFGEQKSCSERAVLVGDAAAQVKPFSGGGIIYGFICADIAARAIKRAFDAEDFSKSFFEREYEAVWHKRLLSKIRTGMGLRTAIKSLDDVELDALFCAISEQKSAVEKYGDMDFL